MLQIVYMKMNLTEVKNKQINKKPKPFILLLIWFGRLLPNKYSPNFIEFFQDLKNQTEQLQYATFIYGLNHYTFRS